MFEREVKKTAYVTNATANSVAFYAWLYISRCTEEDITQDKLKDMFLKQSEEFLAIYAKLQRNPDELINRLKLSPVSIPSYVSVAMLLLLIISI